MLKLPRLLKKGKYKKLPILGVHNSGKTYFLTSLGYLISRYGWGTVCATASVYFNKLLEYVLRGEPIPPTYKNYPIEIKINSIVLPEDNLKPIPCNLIIYTEDFRGKDYEFVMNELVFKAEKNKNDFYKVFEKFRNLYKGADGIIAIIDLVGNATTEDFRKNKTKFILNALSRQVIPIIKGIQLVSEVTNLRKKPVFFVFTKSDIHGLSTDEISKYFDKIMEKTLKKLKDKGAIIKKYTVCSLGWGKGNTCEDRLKRLEAQGFVEIILDIARIFCKL